MTERYPLAWPSTRPRKPAGHRIHGRFNRKVHNGRYQETKSLSVADAVGRLQEELDRLGATYAVISTNLVPRLDGLPRSGQAEPEDPGVALYFQLDGKPHCMPCDTYLRVADNIVAIAKHIEATRAIDRYGVATVAEMFTGFQALPAPGAKRAWHEVLELAPAAPVDRATIEAQYRKLAGKRHPDVPGGSHDAMAELNRAREQALEAYAHMGARR